MHRRLFGVTPQFDQEYDGLVLTRAEFDAPLAGFDPAMAREVERLINQVAQKPGQAFRQRVGELISLLLPSGTCTADRTARHLGIDRRTLYRRLAAEGVTFAELLDAKRRALAVSLMANPRRSLTEICDLTGFASASSFSHWFRASFGCSPREFRRTQIAEQAGPTATAS
jgi:AraC-like DNA-binding protein